MGRVERYGPDASQVVDVHEPVGAVRGTAFVIHGGFWRARFTSSLMDDLCAALVDRQWRAVNVEYRRVGAGGGWPATADDVRAALGHVLDLLPDGEAAPRVSVGHSAGGHLALLTADLVDAVVALAPVTDLVQSDRGGIGENATAEFMAGSSGEHPAEYRAASPVDQLPVRRRVLVVHGDVDERVPVAQSREYVRRAVDAGDDVDYLELPDVPHRQVIDPSQPYWADIFAWLDGVQR